MELEEVHIHLVSDSTGETVSSVARAALAQFDGIEVEEHPWSLVRTRKQVDKVLLSVSEIKGFVLYTIADEALRHYLKEGCEQLNIPCVSVLSRVISDLSGFLGMKSTNVPGKQHALDEEYFSRVEAVNFSITHDDGQSTWDLEEADIVLVGASRTSKSPTSMYLAHRGYRTANVPYVKGVPLPGNIEKLKTPLVVGLTISPDVLVQIRRNRLLSINEAKATNYTDMEEVEAELVEAKRYFAKNRWPVVDVTRRSIEETTATIIQYYQKRKNGNHE